MKFKIGDKVKVIGNQYNDKLLQNSYEIVRIENSKYILNLPEPWPMIHFAETELKIVDKLGLN